MRWMIGEVLEKASLHAEQASTAARDGALELALSKLIIASECYVQAIGLSKDRDEKRRLRSLFDDCTEKAERIREGPPKHKAATDQSVSSKPSLPSNHTSDIRKKYCSQRSRTASPSETRTIPKKEQLVLLKSAKIGDRIYPIWNQDNVENHLNLADPFTDSVTVFSDQWTFVKGYDRLPECIPDAQLGSDVDMPHTTLSQTGINDCSFVASLIVATQWSSRFQSPLITENLYPQDEQSPVISTNGKYMYIIHLNGTRRQLVIDDFLPLGTNGSCREIFLFSSKFNDVVWPALVQKAFWKVAGVNFQGSNSASDLRLLTGWVPERLPLYGSSFDLEELWDRLHQKWNDGDVLMTLGTGILSPEEEADLGLVSEHNYAVTGMTTIDDRRLMTIQNPWQGPSEQIGSDRTPITYKTNFELDFSQAVQQFNTLFMNWNPSLWKYTSTAHFSTTADRFSTTDYNVAATPQYVINNSGDDPVDAFILLSRHRQALDSAIRKTTYTTLGIYDNHGAQVITSDNAKSKTDDDASLEVTSRCTIPPHKSYTIVINQRSPLPIESMTLTIYYTLNTLHLSDPTRSFQIQQSISSSWSGSEGPPSHKSFSKNPHFLVTLTRPTVLKVILESPGTLLTLDLFHTHARPLKRDRTMLVCGTGEYRIDAQCLTAELLPGRYCVVPSPYKPLNIAKDFTLSWFAVPGQAKEHGEQGEGGGEDGSVARIELGKVLGSGQLKKVMASHWSKPLAISTFDVVSEWMNAVTVHVHPFTQSVWHRISLVQEDGGNTRLQVAKVEGRGGLALEKVVVVKGKRYLLVCELLERDRHGEFEVQVYSDSALRVNRL